MANGDERRWDTYRRYIIRWEQGVNTPDEGNRNAYADAIGCPRSLFREDQDLFADLTTTLRSVIRAATNDQVKNEITSAIGPILSAVESLAEAVDRDDDLVEAIAQLRVRCVLALDRLERGEGSECLAPVVNAGRKVVGLMRVRYDEAAA